MVRLLRDCMYITDRLLCQIAYLIRRLCVYFLVKLSHVKAFCVFITAYSTTEILDPHHKKRGYFRITSFTSPYLCAYIVYRMYTIYIGLSRLSTRYTFVHTLM